MLRRRVDSIREKAHAVVCQPVIETLEGRQLLHGGHDHLNAPYFGAPVAVGDAPVTVQAEHYDHGGQAIAYHDTSAANTWGEYRTGTDAGVDLRQFSTGQYRISDAYEGEWVLYTIDVKQAGTYTLDLRLSNADPGAKLHVEIGGVDVTGPVTVPDTNNFNTLTTVRRTITLAEGESVLKLSFDVGSGPTRSVAGVDWLRLTLNEPAPSVPPAAPSGNDAIALSASQVRVRWEDNADSEAGYRIYRKSGNSGTWHMIDQVSVNETEYLDNGLSPDTHYIYRVAAFNAFGESAFSNEEGTTTHASNPGGTVVTWQTVAPSPFGRAEAQGGVVNGKLYVFGGLYLGNGKILGTTRSDVYDPATNRWTRLKDAPDKITHAATVVVGQTIWVIGGFYGDDGPAVKKVWKYDTTRDVWTRGPDLPHSRGAGGAALLGNTIYYFGGNGYDRTWSSGSTWALDVTNLGAGWTSRAAMPNPRNHMAGAAVTGYVYAVGGQHGQSKTQVAQRDIHRYDPVADSWEKVAEFPTVRSHINAATFVLNGKIIILGGETGHDTNIRNVTAFDPLTNTTYEMSPLPEGRSTSVAGVLPDGRIITATGSTPLPGRTTYLGTIS